MKTTIFKIVSLTALGAALCCLAAQSPASVWDGVYSPEQAKRGAALYKQDCAACHGDNLEGDAQTERAQKLNRVLPPLSGDTFKGNWNGRPLSDLYDKIRKTMPRDDPGTISLKDNADILAYVLNFNGFPAGNKDLAADADSMTDIIFEVVKPK
jgi:S-disulfanyl-L-cysteine oxidoreductase SoxD